MIVKYHDENMRVQCAFVSNNEVNKICTFIASQKNLPEKYLNK